jgi:hypothetical protein
VQHPNRAATLLKPLLVIVLAACMPHSVVLSLQSVQYSKYTQNQHNKGPEPPQCTNQNVHKNAKNEARTEGGGVFFSPHLFFPRES